MPAAKFLPQRPSTTTLPPVMYSQQWSPAPSATAVAPLFLTQNLSPTEPLMYSSPDVAPYRMVLPAMTLHSGISPSGVTTIFPPESPFPT